MERFVYSSLLLAALGIGYFVYDAIYDAHNFSYRTKLTLTISTPEGPITASGVKQIDASKSFINFAETGGNYWTRKSEALVVDLGQGRYVFAPPKNWPNLAEEMSAQGIIQAQVEPISVPIERMRWMVTFADVSDPGSIIGVNSEDLAATFGRGYALTDVTIQATDDPLTIGQVERVLGWLPGHKNWLSYTTPEGKIRDLGVSDLLFSIRK
jgi:hypothetical protein